MKKIVLTALFAFISLTLFAQTVPQGLRYRTEGQSVTITGYTGRATTLVIPAQIQGRSVTTIEAGAFAGDVWNGIPHPLTSITIPSSVTFIGGGAFAYTNLTSVTFEGSITNLQGRTPYPPDYVGGGLISHEPSFDGNLRDVYMSAEGGMGTYVVTARNEWGTPTVWTKQSNINLTPHITDFFGTWLWDGTMIITIYNSEELKLELYFNQFNYEWVYFNYQIDGWTVSTPPRELAEIGYTRGYRLTGRVVSNGGYFPWIHHQINATPSIHIYIYTMMVKV